MAGTRITDATLKGAIPAADSAKYDSYIHAWHDYRLTELLFTPDVTVYVSSGGSDSNDGLTTSTPYLTIQKARDVRQADSGNSYLILLDGDSTFRITDSAALWSVSTASTRIGAYGSGIPTVTRSVVFTSGWTLVSGTRYKRAYTTTAHSIWLTGDIESPTYQAETEADATTYNDHAGVIGAWYLDTVGDELFVDFGIDANTLSIEVVDANSYDGFFLTGDLTSVWNLDVFGFGCGNSATQKQGITLNTLELKRSGIIGCGVFGGGTHACAVYGGSAGHGNGIFLISNSRFGSCGYGGAGGETILNFYQHSGGGEALVYNPTIVLGTLPSYQWYDPSDAPAERETYRGADIFSHSASGEDEIELLHVYCEPGHNPSPDRLFAGNGVPRVVCQTQPTFATRANHGCVVANWNVERRLGLTHTSLWPASAHFHACSMFYKPAEHTIRAMTDTALGGLHTACEYLFDFSDFDTGQVALVNALTAESNPKFVNCTLLISGRTVSGRTRINYDGGNRSPDMTFDNCVVGYVDMNPGEDFNIDAAETNINNCVIMGEVLSTEYDGGTNNVAGTLASSQLRSRPLNALDPRYQTGSATTPTYDPTRRLYSSDIGHLGSGLVAGDAVPPTAITAVPTTTQPHANKLVLIRGDAYTDPVLNHGKLAWEVGKTVTGATGIFTIRDKDDTVLLDQDDTGVTVTCSNTIVTVELTSAAMDLITDIATTHKFDAGAEWSSTNKWTPARGVCHVLEDQTR